MSIHRLLHWKPPVQRLNLNSLLRGLLTFTCPSTLKHLPALRYLSFQTQQLVLVPHQTTNLCFCSSHFMSSSFYSIISKWNFSVWYSPFQTFGRQYTFDVIGLNWEWHFVKFDLSRVAVVDLWSIWSILGIGDADRLLCSLWLRLSDEATKPAAKEISGNLSIVCSSKWARLGHQKLGRKKKNTGDGCSGWWM